jgi:hypothetical protein
MVARHVTAVHLDGCDEEGFWTWCANQAIEPMDRDHPLWRVTFATGLASGRVGVLVVMHHALADGIAGAALAARLLDPAPDTVAAVPVAVAALSYAGELVVSIQVDGAVDDLEVLAAGITEGLDQLMPPRPSGDRGGTSLWGGVVRRLALDVDDLGIGLGAAGDPVAAEDLGACDGGPLLEGLGSEHLDDHGDPLARSGAANLGRAEALGRARPGMLGDGHPDLRGAGGVAGDLQRHLDGSAPGEDSCRGVDLDVQEQPSGEEGHGGTGGGEQRQQAAEEDGDHRGGSPSAQLGSHGVPLLGLGRTAGALERRPGLGARGRPAA